MVRKSPVCGHTRPVLCKSAGRTVSRDAFINELWDGNYLIGNKALTNVIWELRQALPDDKSALITMPRQGYCLKSPVEVLEQPDALAQTKPGVWIAAAAVGLITVLLIYLFRPVNHSVQLQDIELLTDVPGFHENPDYDAASDTLLYATINGETASIVKLESISSSSPNQQAVVSSMETMFGSPVFSPDGQRFAYFESPRNSIRCHVKVASVDGAETIRVAEAACIPLGVTPYGLDWYPVEDRLLYSAELDEGGIAIHEVDLVSGEISVLTQPEYLDLLPFYEAGGDSFLFVRLLDPEHSYSYRGFADGLSERLMDIPAKYAGIKTSPEINGLLLTKHDGQDWHLYRQSDEQLLKIDQAPLGIKTFSLSAANVFFSVSRARTQIYTARLDNNGEYEIDSLQVVRKVDWQPDFADSSERLVYVSDRSGHEELWMSELNGEAARQITEYQSRVRFPSWSSNEQWVAFNVSDRSAGGLRLEVIDLASGDIWHPAASANSSFIDPVWDINSRLLYSLETSDQGLPLVWVHYPFTSEPSRRLDRVIADQIYAGDQANTLYFLDQDGNIQHLDIITGESSFATSTGENVGITFTNNRLYLWLAEDDRLMLYEQQGADRQKLLEMSTADLLPKEILFDVSQDGRIIVWSVGKSAQNSIFRGRLEPQ